MRTQGNATTYSGGTTHRPLPPVDLTVRPSVPVQTWTCPTAGCGFTARRQTFHLCVTAPETPVGTKRRRASSVNVTELSAAEVERKFTPVAPVPEFAGLPVVLDETVAPDVVELRNDAGETLAVVKVDPVVEEPAPRVRAKVTAAKPGPGVLISLTGAVSTVEVSAVLSGLLRALNGVGKAARTPVRRTPKPKAALVAAPKVGVGRGAGGGPGNKGGTVTARYEEVERRYLDGESLKELAADLGVTSNAIGQALRRRGVVMRTAGDTQRGTPRPSGRTFTDEQAAEVADLYRGGMSMLKIAERYGASKNGVRVTLQRLGVPARPSGKRAPASEGATS